MKIDDNCIKNLAQKAARGFSYFFSISFITSPAIMSPTTEGTKETDPGTLRLAVHVLAVPGGQMQFSLQPAAGSTAGGIGGSFE